MKIFFLMLTLLVTQNSFAVGNDPVEPDAVTKPVTQEESVFGRQVLGGFANIHSPKHFDQTQAMISGALKTSKQNTIELTGVDETRKYINNGPRFNKQTVMLADTYALKKNWYFDASGSLASSAAFGSSRSLQVTPHYTGVNDFEFSLSVRTSHYQLVDATGFDPGMIWIINDHYQVGETTYIVNIGRTYIAERLFGRFRVERWHAELSLSAGDSIEDVGVIDRFKSVSIGAGAFVCRFLEINLNAESRKGELRDEQDLGIALRAIF